MSDGHRILVVVDPTADDQPAVARAATLAQALGCGIELFICHYDPYLSGERFFDSPGLQKARRDTMDAMLARLARLAEPLAAEGLDVNTEVAWDTPLHEGIVRRALTAKPTLILKDTHYHQALRRSVFSNTDWNLIRTCPVPLWLVKPRAVADRLRIVAAVDPMHEHDKPASLDHIILREGERLADATGGELHAFHSYDPMPAIAGTATAVATPISVPAEDIGKELARSHGEALGELAETYRLSADRIHLHRGPAREVLPAVARELDAGLVIMGAVARGRLKRFFIGSTAEQVLDRLPCDVLVMKPDEFATPVRLEDAAARD